MNERAGLELAMIYDADGGVVGEAKYVVGHLLGRTQCSLCDITHGPVKRKADFDDLVRGLEADGHSIETLHRNELTPEQAAASAGHLPCVIARPAGSTEAWRVLVTSEQLGDAGGDVASFGTILGDTLTAA